MYESDIFIIIILHIGLSRERRVTPIPIYKINGKKDGLQKYIVRINYISDSGQPKQLSRIAYGADKAKTLEMRLLDEIKFKHEMPVKKMTVQELFNEYKEVKKYEIRKRTFIQLPYVYNRFILPTYKDYRIDKLNVRDIQNWKIAMEQMKLAIGTKKLAFTYFSAMMNYAVKMEYLQKNPLLQIGNFKSSLYTKPKMKFYTQDEFKRFITSAKEYAEKKEKLKNDLSEWNYYVFFNIAFFTGLRKGEIYALKWSDIDDSYLTVSRSLFRKFKNIEEETAPKNMSSIRTLQMPVPLLKILEEHKKRQQLLHNFTDDFRICSNIKDTALDKRNKQYSASVELKTIRIHGFRHSHASVLANNNINIQEVARRLGHSRIEITWNTYCHLYPKEEEKAVAVLNSFI